MDDLYNILGVKRGDTDEAIRQAYRKLAKRHHPDLNPDKPEAVERFKAINAANQILSDPGLRARYDRGEIDGTGAEKAPEPPRYRDSGGGRYGGTQGFDSEDLESLFGGAFGGRGGFARRGSDANYSLTVSFLDAATGAVRRLTLPDGKTLDVTIPAGLRDGHVLRLKGQGRPGRSADGKSTAEAGDALVEINVAPHPFFRREGNDILLELPVTLQEAVLGGAVQVPTISGRVKLTIPPHSGNGTKLRLGKRGIAGGSQIVELKLVLPTGPDPALDAFLATWQPSNPLDPRAAMEASS